MDTNPALDKDYHTEDCLPQAQRKREPRSQASRSQAPRSQPPARHKSELREIKTLERVSTIRDMARDFGVSIRALRFYEDRGLLHPRRDGTARHYGPRERLHLKMILKGKQLGFTLSEIHDMLASREEATAKLDFGKHGLDDLDMEEMNLEMGLPPEQIVAQINHLERQRKELDEAIVALRHAHQRLLQSPRRSALS